MPGKGEGNMFAWIAANLGTILTALVLTGAVALIILNMRKEKKKSRSGCCGSCGNCGSCAMCGACRAKQRPESTV